MNILLAVSTMHPRDGGPPKVVAGLAKALALKGQKVTIIAATRPDEADFVHQHWVGLTKTGVNLSLFAHTGPRGLYYSREMVRYVRANDSLFDVLHNHGTWEMSLLGAANAFQKAEKPYFVSAHGTLDPWSIGQKSLKKQFALNVLGVRSMLQGASGLVFGTQDELDMAQPLGLGARSIVVPNGADIALGGRDQAAAKAALAVRFPAMADWDRTALFFARLHPKKGLDMLVEAFARVANAYPKAGLLAAAIPEVPDYEQAIRARIAALGLEQRIIVTTDLIGHEGKQALEAADFFTLPSHQEGFSMSLVEAMGLGLPLLITNRCHMDHIAPAGAGVVAEPTIEGLEAGLRAMFGANSDALQMMGANSRRLAESYSWPNVADQMLDHYRKATAL